MKQLQTKGIVLARTDYGEADRILTVLTPDQGKLRLLAKGVRRIKSKLAGGIELFSVSDLTYLPGRREIGTLIASRLQVHYGQIVQDINRTMFGYELIKRLNKATEDEPEAGYYQLLDQAFVALNQPLIAVELIDIWFSAQLLRLDGHTPNLTHDKGGNRLIAETRYDYDFNDTVFIARPNGNFDTDAIKFLRLLFSAAVPQQLAALSGVDSYAKRCLPLVRTQLQLYART